MSNVMIIGIGGAGCNMAETFNREAKSEQLKTAQYVFIGMEEDLANHQKDDGRIFGNVSQNIPVNFFAGFKRALFLSAWAAELAQQWHRLLRRWQNQREWDMLPQ